MFKRRKGPILNIYFTAGHPGLNDSVPIIKSLANEGVDMVEVGMPYSDPLADGPTIQQSSKVALGNGMTLGLLFEQLAEARSQVDIPLVLMGYYNQLLQYGFHRFLDDAVSAGVDGLIIPDLPMDIYEENYAGLFTDLGLTISFLVTPQTSDARILKADKLSSGFLYVVSKSSITGGSGQVSLAQKNYFTRINNLELQSPRMIGFGIHDRTTYKIACQYADGAIIGSAFIRRLDGDGALHEKIRAFVTSIR